MYVDKLKCVVCEKETKFSIKTKLNEINGVKYSVIQKNGDNTFKCEIDIKCEHCGITQRIYRDIEFR